MKRLNFVFGDMCCVRMRIADSSGTRYFYIETEKEAKNMEIDIFGESFDIILTPLIPDFQKDLEEIDQSAFKEKTGHKLFSSVANFGKDLFFRIECTYHLENFNDGDTVNINMTVYNYPTNNYTKNPLWWLTDIWDLFPVMYMFYDVLLKKNRIEPKETSCIDRKITIRKVRKFVFFNAAFMVAIIDYPINMVRLRCLSREQKIFSSLLKFARMDEEKRWKYIGDEDFFKNVV